MSLRGWSLAALVAGYVSIVLGWVFVSIWPGVALFIAGGALVTGAAIGGAVVTRSIRSLVVPIVVGGLVFAFAPVAINVAFWIGNGFHSSHGGGSPRTQTPAAPHG